MMGSSNPSTSGIASAHDLRRQKSAMVRGRAGVRRKGQRERAAALSLVHVNVYAVDNLCALK